MAHIFLGELVADTFARYALCFYYHRRYIDDGAATRSGASNGLLPMCFSAGSTIVVRCHDSCSSKTQFVGCHLGATTATRRTSSPPWFVICCSSGRAGVASGAAPDGRAAMRRRYGPQAEQTDRPVNHDECCIVYIYTWYINYHAQQSCSTYRFFLSSEVGRCCQRLLPRGKWCNSQVDVLR